MDDESTQALNVLFAEKMEYTDNQIWDIFNLDFIVV